MLGMTTDVDEIDEQRNEFVRDLSDIDQRGAATTQTVPLDVLDAIDRGRNPEQATLNVLYVFATFSS